MAKSSKQQLPPSVRIIGGRWRGTRLAVEDAEGLRPTGNRIRETLFNWLAGDIGQSICVDLFAGSGALGLEALSRGAQKVVAVEQNRKAYAQLQSIKQKLQADNYQLVCDDALRWFASCSLSIDILFLDPPFSGSFLNPLAALISANQNFKPGAKLYIEQDKQAAHWSAPTGWQLQKSKVAGEVRYELYEFIGNT